MDLGKVGIWTQLDMHSATRLREAATEIESLGYGAIWIPEALGREVFAQATLLLAATERIVVASGIANIWARDAMAMSAGQKTLTEAFPDRFLLGIGVSHAPVVGGFRGHSYEKPLTRMREYLDSMDRSAFMGTPPTTELTRVIGALHPKMLALAAERTGGAHTYFVTPEHTARARAALGPDRLLAVEQAVVLAPDAVKARSTARLHMTPYLMLDNYQRNLESLGFTETDFANRGSDRLVDAIVAWGDTDAIAARVRAHHEAGANHVCIQVLGDNPEALPLAEWRALAPVLLG